MWNQRKWSTSHSRKAVEVAEKIQEKIQPVGTVEAFEEVKTLAKAERLLRGLRARFERRISISTALVLVSTIVVLAGLITLEVRTSWVEAQVMSWVMPELSYKVEPGANPDMRYPKAGPFDIELGYASLPHFTQRLMKAGLEIKSQARLSGLHDFLLGMGLFPIYQEKTTHGLQITGNHNSTIFSESFPKRGYARFEDVPPVIASTLLFIEDRQLLDEKGAKSLNPAISWDRLTKASFEFILDKLFLSRNVPGGSTLATQIEKFRHSPDGRTHSPLDKFKQMASATTRAYLLGKDTREQREQIVTDYINEVPLGAVLGIGEVKGLGEALEAWYGAKFEDVNTILSHDMRVAEADPVLRQQQALAFKRVLSLFLSQRRPAYYLLQDQGALEALANLHLPLMVKAGIITAQLAADAQAISTQPLSTAGRRNQAMTESFIDRKAANAVRLELKNTLGLKTLYELDRLDVEVQSTFDRDLQAAVTKTLNSLRTKEGAIKLGLVGEHMLRPEQAELVNYSFTLVEKLNDRNGVRVQTDTVDAPLDLNRGGKLELGSTAKLRTLITYLEMISELYRQVAPNLESAEAPAAKAWLDQALAKTDVEDEMSKWLYTYLKTQAQWPSLSTVLEAAMNRRYSASPWQGFRTGGGFLRFNNFNRDDNGLDLTITAAFQRSNNLVFVRIMKEVVQHVIINRIPGAMTMLRNPQESMRRVYLERFVERESTAFLRRFYSVMKPMTFDERLDWLKGSRQLTAPRLASLLLSIRQDYDFYAFRLLMMQSFPKLDEKVVARYWRTMNPQVMSLNDRAFVARVHPLAMWIAMHLQVLPETSFKSALASSKAARFSSYKWLLVKSSPARQERDIRTMLEREAFNRHIVKYWQRQGFPFATMTPSYASALGSSGDRPSALADLMGAVNNDGVLMPSVRLEEIKFGSLTPYETTFAPAWRGATRAASPEVAAAAKKALISVVEGGSARRLYKGLMRSDGTEVQIAAKTGTGDNRLQSFGSGGRLIHSDAKSRTATLVFALGDRFFGTITAYVQADDAKGNMSGVGDFSFTSSLVVQALKSLMPDLEPTIMKVEDPWGLAKAE